MTAHTDEIVREYKGSLVDLLEYLECNNIGYVVRHKYIELIELPILIYT